MLNIELIMNYAKEILSKKKKKIRASPEDINYS